MDGWTNDLVRGGWEGGCQMKRWIAMDGWMGGGFCPLDWLEFVCIWIRTDDLDVWMSG